MKKILFALLFIVSINTFSQSKAGQFLDEAIKPLVDQFKSGEITKETLKASLNKVIKNPELYDDVWKQFIDYAVKQDSAWSFLNDLNLKFKTFQTVSNPASALGFTYDFNFNYSNFVKKENARTSSTFSFKMSGDVAFNGNINPNDFLDTSINYSFSRYTGGVTKKNSVEDAEKLMAINRKIALKDDDKSNYSQDLFKERAQYIKLSDQYYFAFGAKASLEADQRFIKKQYTYGATLELGAKGWDNNSTLSKLNIFDYPFALIRWITGTDTKFEPYGSTIPTVYIGLDNVNPQNDVQRQAITGNLDPFGRVNVQSSFRTFVSRIQNENIFFNANIRYYQELNASQAIKNAKLADHFYFVMALESTTGLYVSYAKGTLPFDAISDEVYSVGFNYKL
ncbi:MAG: hypothetical protein JXR05_12840 [Flavobacteriaceae bacterium]